MRAPDTATMSFWMATPGMISVSSRPRQGLEQEGHLSLGQRVQLELARVGQLQLRLLGLGVPHDVAPDEAGGVRLPDGSANDTTFWG